MGLLERSIPLQVSVVSVDIPTQTCQGMVSSASGDDTYHVTIRLRDKIYECRCADFAIRHRVCKHIVALLLAVRRQLRDG